MPCALTGLIFLLPIVSCVVNDTRHCHAGARRGLGVCLNVSVFLSASPSQGLYNQVVSIAKLVTIVKALDSPSLRVGVGKVTMEGIRKNVPISEYFDEKHISYVT
jgi:hypothetical protein